MNSRPHLSALRATAAAALLTLAGASAWADDPVRGDAACTDSDAASTFYNPSYVACSAHYDGVPAPQTTLVDPFAGYGNFRFVGQTANDNSDTGPFDPFGPGFGVPFDTLVLKAAQNGPFVVALASFGDYSLYLYDPSQAGGAVSSIEFTTLGTTNWTGGPYELQYANLYAAVPEPTSLALMLGGLAAVGLARRRRMS